MKDNDQDNVLLLPRLRIIIALSENSSLSATSANNVRQYPTATVYGNISRCYHSEICGNGHNRFADKEKTVKKEKVASEKCCPSLSGC